MKKVLLLFPLILCLASCSLGKSSSDKTNPDDPTPTDPSGDDPVDPIVPPGGDIAERENDIIDPNLMNKNDQFNLLFDYSSKIEIELDFKNYSLLKLKEYSEGEGNDNFIKNEMYHPCIGKITINGVINTYYELGVRMKGNTSRDTDFVDNNGRFVDGHYCHFKLNFAQTFDNVNDNDYYVNPWRESTKKDARKDRKFGGMKKIDLKWNRNEDESFTKENYVLDAFRNEGVLAQHFNLVQLTIKSENDSRTMVYQVLEAVDKQLIKKSYSSDSSGDLYKCCYTDRGKADLKDYDNRKIGVEGQRYRPVYNLKTNESTSDFSSMKNFIDVINGSRGKSGSEFRTIISEYLDIDNFLKFSALSWVFGLPDDFRNNFNNYYIYFGSETKALFIPYDNDRCLGIRNGWDKDCKNQYWSSKYAIGAGTDEQSPLNFRLITGGSTSSWPVDTVSQETYHQYCIEYANKYLVTSKFQEFTNQFYYSSKSISDGGNNNDSFEVYASAKKSTLDY